jgi:hypothetical protein
MVSGAMSLSWVCAVVCGCIQPVWSYHQGGDKLSRDPVNRLSVEQYRAELRRLRTDWYVFGGLVFFIGSLAPVSFDAFILGKLGNAAIIFGIMVFLLYALCRGYDENRLLWRVQRE